MECHGPMQALISQGEKENKQKNIREKNLCFLCLTQSKAQQTHINTTRPTSEKEMKKMNIGVQFSLTDRVT